MLVHCAHDDLISISDLKTNPKNRNQHPKEQIERLAKILAYQGWRYPIKISNRSRMVVSGHGRIEAAVMNGWDKVPVSYQDYESEEQEFTDSISDNAIASWSELDLSGINMDVGDLGPFDIDLLGIENFTVVPEDKLEPQCDEDEVGEPPKEPISKPGDVWLLGRHRLLVGDATIHDDFVKLMQGEQAHFIWTDPPYNVAYQGKTKDALEIENDSMNNEDFLQFLTDVYTNLFTSVAPGSSIYVAHADSEGANFRNAMKAGGFLFKQCLIWVKHSLVMGRQDYHWKHEPILYGWAAGGSHNWYSDRKQTTVLEFNRPNRNAEHPTMKPVELVEYCMNNSSKPGDIVIDPFLGSGTTLIACEKLNRTCRGIEIDPRYADVIVNRWEKYTGKKAELMNG